MSVTPTTRDEILLAAIAEGRAVSVDKIQPRTRREIYLAYMAGCDGMSQEDLPEPRTREELLMYDMCCNGTGGGGGSATLQDKTFTENGTYKADEGYDGFGSVTVDVETEIVVDDEQLYTNYTNALMGSGLVTYLPPDLTKIGDYKFKEHGGTRFTSLPDSITSIGKEAFRQNVNLAITKLPDSLITVGEYAFYNSKQVSFSEIPQGVKTLGESCFGYNNLEEVTFKGTPTSIGGGVFMHCTNLLAINVPWSEGEVANAPWGATNATINYNYTEE